jgi:hypothetical protein
MPAGGVAAHLLGGFAPFQRARRFRVWHSTRRAVRGRAARAASEIVTVCDLRADTSANTLRCDA